MPLICKRELYGNEEAARAAEITCLKAYPPEGYDTRTRVYPSPAGGFILEISRASSCD